MDNIEDALDDLVSEAKEITAAYEWGTGTTGHENAARRIKKEIADAYFALEDRVEAQEKRIQELEAACKHLAYAAKMKRAYDIDSREEFAEEYPEFATGYLHGDIDEYVIEAIEQAEQAIEKVKGGPK